MNLLNVIVRSTAFCLAGATTLPVYAQERFPERPLRLVVPFPPGGGTDIMARNVEAKIGPLLGQPVIVDNKTGAGGAIGASEVARAKPDGYTLLLGTSSTHVINQLAMDNLSYDAVKSFTPIIVLGVGTYVMVAHPSAVGSLQELIKRAKANPAKYSYGAVSGMAQMSGELFKTKTGTDILHVPYRITGQNLQDLMGGQIPLTSTVLSVVTPHHHAGKVRILAVFGAMRSSAVPAVPTAIEDGVPGMIAYSFNIVFAPAGTPRTIIDRLHQAAARVTKDEAFQKALDKAGIESVTDSTPDRAAQLIKEELVKWAPIVKAANMKVN